MKRVLYIVFIVLFLTACYNWEKFEGPGIAATIEELVVDENFDWQTSSTIQFILSNVPEGTVLITSPEGNIIYHKGYFSGYPPQYTINVNLPDYVGKVAINNHVVEVTGSVVSYRFSSKNSEIVSEEDYSLEFDGINDYVEINETSLLTGYPFTFCAWVRTNGFINQDEDMVIMDLADPSNSSVYYGIYLAADENGVAGIKARKGSTRISTGTTILTDGEWHFIAGVFAGKSNRKLYVDGELEAFDSQNSNFDKNARLLSFGRWGDKTPGSYFMGNIDDVSLWDVELSQEELTAIMNNPPNGNENGLLGYWKFNTGTGTTVFDETVLNNHGTLNGAVWQPDNGNLNDSDNDGVNNSDDDYQNDTSRAFNNFFPAASFGSLAFEDLWPGIGDYDFNDIVIDYRFKTVTSASNYVTEIYGYFVVRAIGASFENGFGFQFPNNNVSGTDLEVTGCKLDVGYISLNSNGTEASQERNTVIVFENGFNVLPNQGGEIGVNTNPDGTYTVPDTVVVSMVFTHGKYTQNDIAIFDFNPFIIVNMFRSTEIHLPDFPPTSLADTNVFGLKHDNSIPSQGRYYKTENGLPWAINIYESFAYPAEKQKINNAYLRFSEWAASSGDSYSDWYQDDDGYRDEEYIY